MHLSRLQIIPNRDERLDNIRQNQLLYQLIRHPPKEEVRQRFHEGQQVLIKSHQNSDLEKGITADFVSRWLGPYVI